MRRHSGITVVLVVSLVVAGALTHVAVYGGAKEPAASSTPSQAPSAEQLRLYEAFRAWIAAQPADVHQEADEAIWARYVAVLRAQGQSERQAAETIEQLKQVGDRAEIERWNRILTADRPVFNTAPNAFLVEKTKSLKPGASLDVGMGQGRNTIYLAQHGHRTVVNHRFRRETARARRADRTSPRASAQAESSQPAGEP